MSARRRLAAGLVSSLHALLPGRLFYGAARFALPRLPHSVAVPLAQTIIAGAPARDRERHLVAGTLRAPRGVRLRLDPSCDHSSLFSLLGYYEPDLTRIVRQRARGGTMVDLGANYGYYSALWLAGHPATRAVAVEPTPDSLVLLRENLAPFGERARIVAACISDHEGAATMHYIGGRGMLSQVLDPRNRRNPDDLPEEGRFDVAATRLESVFRDHLRDASCEFLKVDIEGMDALVLLDSAPLFAAHRIRCVAWESTGSAADHELRGVLARSGYHALACNEADCYALD